jgi:uncharacterized protein (DUF302 family)
MPQETDFELRLELPFARALEEVEKALKALDFTIVTRIDVQRMMKEKMNVDFHPYTILGACDTPIATRGIEIDPSIGLMLPCNVAVETGSDGHTWVRVADPSDSLGCRAAQNPLLSDLAEQAARRMHEVITYLQQSVRPDSAEAKPWQRLAHPDHE